MADGKSHAATPRRREKAREQGDIPHSRELTSAAAMLSSVVALSTLLATWPSRWNSAYRAMLSVSGPAHWEPGMTDGTISTLRAELISLSLPVLWAMLAGLSAALLIAMAQTGGVTLRFQTMEPKLSRLNPVSNIKHIFSAQGLMRLLKSLVPAAVLLGVGWHRLLAESTVPPFSWERIPLMASDLKTLLLWAAAALFVWAGLDYGVERWRWEDRLKMSRQELVDENKESEGSPQIKSRIRSLQRQMRRRKLRGEVQKAAVVITNPTHYAVALEFSFETMEAPKVLAKGRNLLAFEIRDEARWAGVPIVENPPLARSLYKLVDVGETIPANLYAAVASILAWIYRSRMEQEQRERRAAAERARASGRAWDGWAGQKSAKPETAAKSAIVPTLRSLIQNQKNPPPEGNTSEKRS